MYAGDSMDAFVAACWLLLRGAADDIGGVVEVQVVVPQLLDDVEAQLAVDAGDEDLALLLGNFHSYMMV